MMTSASGALLSFIVLLAQTNEASAVVALRGHDVSRLHGKPPAGHLAPDLAAGSPLKTGIDGLVSLAAAEMSAASATGTSSGAPSIGAYVPQCETYMADLVKMIDETYTDAQMETVFKNECLLAKEFPRSFDHGFKGMKTPFGYFMNRTQVCLEVSKGLSGFLQNAMKDPSELNMKQVCEGLYHYFYTANIGLDECPCVGFDDMKGTIKVDLGDNDVSYPAELGGSCKAWDAKHHPECEGALSGDQDVPEWCKKQWCYVDPCNCKLATPPKVSSYMPGSKFKGRSLYYSYGTCMSEDVYTATDDDACVNQDTEDKCTSLGDKCAWSKDKKCLGKELCDACEKPLPTETLMTSGSTACMCVGITNRTGDVAMAISGGKVPYSAETGSSCKAWDHTNHPDCQGNHMPAWCLQAWCFVDPCQCDLPDPPKVSTYMAGTSFQGKSLYWSYATCGGTDMYTSTAYLSACVNQMSEEACGMHKERCSWTGARCLGKELVDKCPSARVEKELAEAAALREKAMAIAAAPAPAPAPAPGPAIAAEPPTLAPVTTPLSLIGSMKCPCVGFAGLEGETNVMIETALVDYPADLGGSCTAWDAESHPACKEGDAPGWCADKWCYVDPCNCELDVLPKKSTYLPGATFQGKTVYYSYATCGAKDQWTSENNEGACVNSESEEDCSQKQDCAWSDGKCGGKEIMGECKVEQPEEKIGSDKCKCIGIWNQPGSLLATIGQDKVKYPADTGAMCSAWDKDNNPECGGESPPDWCAKSWCFVDPCECDLPVPPKTSSYLENVTFQAKPLFYSYSTCGEEDTYTKENREEACVSQDSEEKCNALTKCAWAPTKECLGKELVGKCPKHQLKIQEYDAGSPGCMCIGIAGVKGESDVTYKGSFLKYPADLGGYCEDWDSKVHPECKADSPPEWCSQKWCYVDPCTCNQERNPILGSYMPGANFQGKPLYYSYGTCGGKEPEAKPACALEATKEGCVPHSDCDWTGVQCVLKELANICDAEQEDKSKPQAFMGTGKCQCIGINNVSGYTSLVLAGVGVEYEGDMGSSCKAWDQNKHPSCNGLNSPPWCNKQWCFVDPCDCELPIAPKESKYLPEAKFQNHGLYYSYATCMSEDTWSADNNQESCAISISEEACNKRTSCGWDGSQCLEKELLGKCAAKQPETKKLGPPDLGDSDCSCLGWTGVEGESGVTYGRGLAQYPADVGAHCRAWDSGVHPECQSRNAPGWCKQEWCYVDPCKCKLQELPKITVTNMTYLGRKIFYSYATCKSEDSFTADNNPDACINQKDYHSCTFHEQCGWDGAKCNGKAQLDYCDKGEKTEVVGQKGCRCVGFAGQNGTKTIKLAASEEEYPADVGASCKAWDDEEHPDCSADVEDADKPAWCLKKWCFVDPCSCDLKIPPKTTQYLEGAKWGKRPGYYSYATCGEEDEYTAENFKEECTNQATKEACSTSEKCMWNPKAGACMGKDIGFMC